MDFPDIMEAFLLEPNPEHRERLQQAVLRSPRYDPLVSIPALVREAEEAGGEQSTAQAVLEALRARMPGLVLSPQAHGRLAEAYSRLGRAADAAREQKIAALALRTLRDSGDGTEESPYAVLRIEDEYDLLAAAGLRSVSQELREREHGAADVHTLADGATVWFELLWRTPDRS